MSFILDALKKSEHARQSQAGPSLADVHLHRPRGERPWWALLIAALLAVNVLVLILVLTRNKPEVTAVPAPPPPAVPAAVEEPAPRRDPPVASSGPQVSLRTLAGQAQPAATTPYPQTMPPASAQPQSAPDQTAIAPAAVPAPVAPAPQRAGEVLPTVDELIASGTRLPELHLDIHVDAPEAAQRFVFINMRKYSEGDTLNEGPRLERITRDGAILNQHGLRFLLPRQ